MHESGGVRGVRGGTCDLIYAGGLLRRLLRRVECVLWEWAWARGEDQRCTVRALLTPTQYGLRWAFGLVWLVTWLWVVETVKRFFGENIQKDTSTTAHNAKHYGQFERPHKIAIFLHVKGKGTIRGAPHTVLWLFGSIWV